MREGAAGLIPRIEFEAWLTQVVRPGYRLAFSMLQDQSAAEDVLQEASIKAWRNFSRWDPERPALPWFLAIVGNCCRSRRRSRRHRDEPLEDSLVAQAEHSDDLVRKEDLRRALLRLKPDDRLIVVLHYYCDLPLAEVAQVSGMNLARLKTRLYRAVKLLRPAVEFEDGLR